MIVEWTDALNVLTLLLLGVDGRLLRREPALERHVHRRPLLLLRLSLLLRLCLKRWELSCQNRLLLLLLVPKGGRVLPAG